jgi:hypothetical protein
MRCTLYISVGSLYGVENTLLFREAERQRQAALVLTTIGYSNRNDTAGLILAVFLHL